MLARVQRRTRREIREQQQQKDETRGSYCCKKETEVTKLQSPIFRDQVQQKVEASDTEMTGDGDGVSSIILSN